MKPGNQLLQLGLGELQNTFSEQQGGRMGRYYKLQQTEFNTYVGPA